MMTATKNNSTVAPKNMEEAYTMIYGKIGEIRYSNYIVWLDSNTIEDSKQIKK